MPLPSDSNHGPGYTLTTLSIALEAQDPRLDRRMVAECTAELRYKAQYTLNATRPYGLIMEQPMVAWRQWGWVFLWATPEFGGRIGFPPPEKNELVLSIKTPEL